MALRCRNRLLLLIFTGSMLLGCSTQNKPNTTEHLSSTSQVKTDKQSIVEKLKDSNHLSVDEQIHLYHELKTTHPDGYTFENEDQLTMYGYGMLWEDRPSDALAIFQLIAEEFPESANAYDSLGEAYFVLGKTEIALQHYRKALAMNPDNYNAEDYIERILYPDKKVESPQERFVKIFTKQVYQDDLEDLANKLIKTHPGVFKFTPEAAFRKIVSDKKALVTDQTTYGTFRWYCNEIVASVNCSHTDVGGFFLENEMIPNTLRFPLQTAWVKDKLYITDPLGNQNSVNVKDEILSINGVPVDVIMKDIYRHIPSQGLIETTKQRQFNKWSTGMISCALDFPKEYSVMIKGNPSSIVLTQLDSHNDPLDMNPINGCGEPLCLDWITDDTAVLSIFSFVFYRWNNYDKFVEFMDQSFRQIKEKKIKNLIIDVRGNGGGAPEASIYLLQYLANQPFIYFPNREPINGGGTRELFDNAFNGNQYYLIDGYGNSTTGHFMAMVKDMNLGIIIGEELGSNQFCTAGQTIFKLKNTRLQFYSANNENRVTVNSLPDEKGILPDHYVYQGIEEYLNKVDAVKNYVLKLIQE